MYEKKMRKITTFVFINIRVLKNHVILYKKQT